MRKLPDKGRQGGVGQTPVRAVQKGIFIQMRVDLPKEKTAQITVMNAGGELKTQGVFVAVEVWFENPIVPFDPGQGSRHVFWRFRQPVKGVMLVQRPEHDVQTLVQHPGPWRVCKPKHWDCAFGGQGQHVRWLVFQHNFAVFVGHLAHLQGQSGSHGVRAAPKRVQNGCGFGWHCGSLMAPMGVEINGPVTR